MTTDNPTPWTEDATQLEGYVASLKQRNISNTLIAKALLRLYWQRPVALTQDPERPYQEITTFESLQQLGFNRTKSVVRAAIALVCRKLACKIMPVGATLKIENDCKIATRIIEGAMDNTKFWRKSRDAARDSMTALKGVIEWYIDPTGELGCGRINPLWVFTDPDEGDTPAHFVIERPATKIMLAARYPDKKEEIMGLPAWHPQTVVGVDPPGAKGTNSVKVTEGWRIKLGDEDGCRAVTCGDLVLVDPTKPEGKWTHEFPPLAILKWDNDFNGFDGVPLARDAAPYHLWSNSLVRMVYESLQGAVPWVLQHADGIAPNISDIPYQRVTWSGPYKPEIQQNSPASPQVLAEIGTLKNELHDEVGISQHLATGNVPTGLKSSPAQREWVDNASMLMLDHQEAWADFVAENGKIIVALASDAYRNKAMRVKAPATDMLDEIKWPIDLKEEQFSVRFAASSGLSLTPAHRMEQLGELRDRGAIDEGDYLRELSIGVPDVARTSDEVNASRNLVLTIIANALEDGKFSMPSQMLGEQGLQALITKGTQRYQLALLSEGKYPAENVECLRRVILAATTRLKQLSSPPPAPVLPVPAVLPGQPAGVAPMPSSVLPPIQPGAPGNMNAPSPAQEPAQPPLPASTIPGNQ